MKRSNIDVRSNENQLLLFTLNLPEISSTNAAIRVMAIPRTPNKMNDTKILPSGAFTYNIDPVNNRNGIPVEM